MSIFYILPTVYYQYQTGWLLKLFLTTRSVLANLCPLAESMIIVRFLLTLVLDPLVGAVCHGYGHDASHLLHNSYI